jgi:hypothetical protein
VSSKKVAIEIPAKYPMTGYQVQWLDVESAEELRIQLQSKGITKFARYVRDPLTNDGSVQGDFAPLESISEADVQWVTTGPRTESRYLLCADR